MADIYISFEIQEEIMKKLAVKSLIRFRSVSKPWKSLIESSKFIANHSVNHKQTQHHILVRYMSQSEQKYVSIIDSDTLTHEKVYPTTSVNMVENEPILGSSHGLLCLYDSKKSVIILWNPLIRKSVRIDVSFPQNGYTDFGFGVCPNSDPTLVKIIKTDTKSLQVEVFKLSSRVWRSLSINQLPRKSIRLYTWEQVVIDGIIYWKAYDTAHFIPPILIMSFDLTTEEFSEVHLPEHLAHISGHFFLSKISETIALLEYSKEAYKPVLIDVWMMEHFVSKSFKKLYTIKSPETSILKNVLAFRKNGEPVMEMIDGGREVSGILEFGIYGICGSFSVTSYTETLLLLDQPNPVIL